jgi:hypothetical protein
MTLPRKTRVMRIVVALLLTMLTGCAVVRLPVRGYHFAYCDQMNRDGVHCDRWATPCGSLHCSDR